MGFALFLFGAEGASALTSQWKSKTQFWYVNDKKLNFFMNMLFIVSVAVGVVFIYEWKDVPFLKLFGSDQGANALRSQGVRALPDRPWKYFTFIYYLIPFTSWYFWQQWSAKKNKKLFSFALVASSVALFFSVLSLQKGPPLIYILFSILLLIRLGEIKVSVKTCIWGAIALVGYFIFSGVVFSGIEQGGLKPLKAMLNRVFVGQNFSSLYYLDFFPRYGDFLMGRGFPNPRGILPYEVVNVPKSLWLHYKSYLLEQGVKGSLPAYFPMQFYANFGVWVMLLSSLFVGFFAMLFSSLSESASKMNVGYALSVFLGFFLIKLAFADVMTVLLNLSLYISLSLIFLILFFSREEAK